MFYYAPFFQSLTILGMAYSSTIEQISILHLVSLSHIPDQILLVDDSDEEEEIKTETEEEQELGVFHSWIEMGASLHCQRRRHGGYYVRYFLLSLSFFLLTTL